MLDFTIKAMSYHTIQKQILSASEGGKLYQVLSV